MSAPQPSTSRGTIEQLVDMLRTLAGPHPGLRPIHAKGVVCTGTFRAADDARRLSMAAHLQGDEVPVTVRFSNAGGDPRVHDGAPNVRGMAVKFHLPDGKFTDIVANSVDGFFTRTPEEFLELLHALLPDPATGQPSAQRVGAFLADHPAAKAHLDRQAARPVPASYARTGYHAVHAFRFVAADGSGRFGRYHWIPDADEAWLAPEDALKRDPDFLREELAERLSHGVVLFRLTLQLAAREDPTDDATVLWPADRAVMQLGRLQVEAISPTSSADEQRLVFDPTRLTRGIELSADPILLARPEAYSISFERRSKGL